jgi:hypothetical protein
LKTFAPTGIILLSSLKKKRKENNMYSIITMGCFYID